MTASQNLIRVPLNLLAEGFEFKMDSQIFTTNVVGGKAGNILRPSNVSTQKVDLEETKPTRHNSLQEFCSIKRVQIVFVLLCRTNHCINMRMEVPLGEFLYFWTNEHVFKCSCFFT
jgi:hypothetical protein